MEQLIRAILTSQVELVKELLANELKNVPNSKVHSQLNEIQKVYLHEDSKDEKYTHKYICNFEQQRTGFIDYLQGANAIIVQEDKFKWSKVGYGFFHFICKFASESLVHVIIEHVEHLKRCKDHWDVVKILRAVKCGRSVMYDVLLDNETIVAAEVDWLHFYLKSGVTERKIVEKFIKLGADVNLVNAEGESVINKVISFLSMGNSQQLTEKIAKIVKLLLKFGADVKLGSPSPLVQATNLNSLEIVEVLIRSKALSEQDKSKALVLAAKLNFHKIMEILLNYEVDANLASPTALYFAVKRNDREMAKMLLEKRANPDMGNPTPLFLAAKCGFREIVELLLKYKANANLGFPSPLVMAIESRSPKIVELLLQNGAKTNEVPHPNPLVIAIKKNYREIVKLLLEHGDRATARITNALALAIESGFTETVKIILDSGVEVNVGNPTALFLAVKRNNVEMAKMLLERQADPDLGYPTPLFLAAKSGFREIVELLLKFNANLNLGFPSPLVMAIESGSKEIVNLLLQHGAHRNQKNPNPLYIATKKNSEELVKLLLDNGADVTVSDPNALTLAIESGFTGIVKIILDSGINVNLAQPHALDLAAKKGHLGAAKLLLQYGSNEHVMSARPLVSAAESGDKLLVELLLDNGAYVNGRPECSDTPLAAATLHGRKDIAELLLDRGAWRDPLALCNAILYENNREDLVKLLLERGFDPNCSILDDSALCRAIEWGEPSIVKLLLEYGAKCNVLTSFGQYLLNYAAVMNFIGIVELLLHHGADINLEDDSGTALALSIESGYSQLSKILVRQVVLLKSLDSYVSEANLNAAKSTNHLAMYYVDCACELELLRAEKFHESALSCYDVFTTWDAYKLSCFASNENIRSVLRSSDFKGKFAIYGELVVEHFERGVSMKRDFELLKRFVNYLATRDHDQLPKLPFTFVSDLFTYLNEKDLAKLRRL